MFEGVFNLTMSCVSHMVLTTCSLRQHQVQSRRLLAEILLQTSQLRPKDQVVVIAATNRMGEHVRDCDTRNAVMALLASLRSADIVL